MHGVVVVDGSAAVLVVVVGSGGCLDGGGCGGRRRVAGDLGIQLVIHWDWRGGRSEFRRSLRCAKWTLFFFKLIFSPDVCLSSFGFWKGKRKRNNTLKTVLIIFTRFCTF
uniref:Uncharacterized protein n=1 Tax=Solanum lycopersicum TaxID=4081 RepID=A0A3Q7IFU6_SOLLC